MASSKNERPAATARYRAGHFWKSKIKTPASSSIASSKYSRWSLSSLSVSSPFFYVIFKGPSVSVVPVEPNDEDDDHGRDVLKGNEDPSGANSGLVLLEEIKKDSQKSRSVQGTGEATDKHIDVDLVGMGW